MTEEKMRRALEKARPFVELAQDVGDRDDIDAAKLLLPLIDAALSTKQEAADSTNAEPLPVSQKSTGTALDSDQQDAEGECGAGSREAADEMAAQLAELIECAERDMKLNRDEEPGGHWSLRTANCFLPARDALARYRALKQEGLVAGADGSGSEQHERVATPPVPTQEGET